MPSAIRHRPPALGSSPLHISVVSAPTTMTLHETTSRAESLCARCSTTPYMTVFQPIAASAVEMCRAAAAANLAGNGNQTARMEKLAVYVVHETERAANGMEMMTLPLSEDTVRILERLEVKLDEIRRTVEQMPTTMQSKKGKLARYLTLDQETRRPEQELKALVDALLKGIHAVESKGISPMELANLSIRAASAVCEAPVLNFLKPVVGIVEIISETAQTVRSNRQAALQLAAHSTLVTRSIAEHAAAVGMDGSAAPNGKSLVALTSALESIHLYLTDLQKPRRQRRITSWIMANKEKDRIAEFSQGLDKALALFTSTNVLSTRAEVREIATLVRTHGDVKEIATQVRTNTSALTVSAIFLARFDAEIDVRAAGNAD
ncbi:hypothetical protein C8R45DRAFT_1087992 [Mycena sanguinolenta]|nr:hypothetical protein C8R45DRAFT_1087992 [Mycena sanguinolenta]